MNDQRSGRGVLHLADGRVYEGYFERNFYHGYEEALFTLNRFLFDLSQTSPDSSRLVYLNILVGGVGWPSI